MFLGKNRKRFDGVAYEYWTLCETARTERGPRQRVVASLGKLTDEDVEGGWEDLEAASGRASAWAPFGKIRNMVASGSSGRAWAQAAAT